MTAKCPKCGLGNLILITEPNTEEIAVVCSRLDCDYVEDDGVWSDNDSDELICEWPDGTWCYMDERHEMTHMSDDYEVVVYNEKKHGGGEDENDETRN